MDVLEFLKNLNEDITMAIALLTEERYKRRQLFRAVCMDGKLVPEGAELNKNNGVSSTQKENDEMFNIPGISINSKPRADGRFQGYIVIDGVKKYFYGRSKEEVANKVKTQLKNGATLKKESVSNSVPTTFNAFAVYYFENFRKPKVSTKTYKNDTNRYKNYLLPWFKETPIKKITPMQCKELIDKISGEGKGKTADEIYSLLSVIFKTAIKHNILKNNPLDIIFYVKHEKKHGVALTLEEERLFKNALKDNRYISAFMLALYTGLRPNELYTAKIEGNFIVAINSKRKNRKLEYKKIPISKMLKPYIANGLIIPNYKILRETVRKILPNHKLYDLRTTFYSRCKECQISMHAINYFMGHSLGALGNTYTSLSEDFLIEEMAKFDY